MKQGKHSLMVIAVYILAVVLGLLVAFFDIIEPFGDDTAKATIVLWLLSCGSLGLLQPHRPWRWGVLVAPWLPALQFVRHTVGPPDAVHPNSYPTNLILIPISLAICLLAAYAGSFLRMRHSGLDAE